MFFACALWLIAATGEPTEAGTPLPTSPAPVPADQTALPEGTTPAPNAGAAQPRPEGCRIAVMNLEPKGLAEDEQYVAGVLTDSMAAEIAASSHCSVVSQKDISEMLNFEAIKAECASDSASCVAEVGGALGVTRVASGTVARLGESYKLQVKLHDVSAGEVVSRAGALVTGSPEALDRAARDAGRALLGVGPIAATSSSSPPEAAAGSDPSGVVLLGAALTGVGAIAGIGGVVFAVVNDARVGDKSVPGDERVGALGLGRGALIVAAIGAVVVAAGGVLLWVAE